MSTMESWANRLAQLRHRIGRRGAALLAFAFIDVVIGWSLLDPLLQAQTRAAPSYAAIRAAAPLWAWGVVWLVVAGVCVWYAFCGADRWGFAVAIGVKLAWALGFASAWLLYDAPRALLGAATWVVFAGLVLIIAGWPEPGGRAGGQL